MWVIASPEGRGTCAERRRVGRKKAPLKSSGTQPRPTACSRWRLGARASTQFTGLFSYTGSRELNRPELFRHTGYVEEERIVKRGLPISLEAP